MILVSELQLGLKEQTLISVDELCNYKSVARMDLDNLPGAICGFYYGYNGSKVILKGPKQLARKVADDTKDVALALYADRNPINIVIEEY